MDRPWVPNSEQLQIVTYLKNASGDGVSIPFSAAELEYHAEIRNLAGEPMRESSLTRERRAMEAERRNAKSLLRLQAGNGLPADVDIGRMFERMAPGSYTVQLSWAAPKEIGGVRYGQTFWGSQSHQGSRP